MSNELDEIATRYYAAPPSDEWIEDRVVRWVMPKIIGWCEGRTLEMGYGAGRTSGMLYEAGIDLEVVEGSALLVDESATVVPAGRMHHAMFEDFDPGPVYDTVLALHILEHVEDPVGLLTRVYGWLRPGGRLICAVPNANSVHRRVGSLLTGLPFDTPSERDLLVGHRRVYTVEDLRSGVTEAGFRVSFDCGWFLKPTANARMVDWPPEHIDALCQIGWDGESEEAANIIAVAYRP